MAETIKLTLTPTTVDARPGAPVEVVVAIHNTGPTVEQYELQLDGLPSSWYTLPDNRIALFPNDRDEARITILPSQDTAMGAGTHPFTITVAAIADHDEAASVSGTLRVAAAVALDAQLRPSRATGRKARYTVLLHNRGNAALDVDLDAYDSEEGCDFTFQPPLVQVEPGRRATVSMRVRPLHTRLAGPQHPFDFQVAVQPHLGEERHLQGQFLYQPRFRSWRPFFRLVALAVLALIVIIAAPFVISALLSAQQYIKAQANTSIGKVALGATNPNTVMADMGTGATMNKGAATGKGPATTNQDAVITKPQSGGKTITTGLRQGRVVSLETNSPAVKLTNGIHVGSTVSDVKKAFGAQLAVVGGSLAATNAITSGTNASSSPTSTASIASPIAGSGAVSGTAVSGNGTAVTGGAMSVNPLAGGALVVTGTNIVDGQHPQTYFGLDKTGTRVTSIHMGIGTWVTADHNGPTMVKAITSTTWTLDGAPYIIGSGVRIPRGVTLTINPGVHVYFTTQNASLYVDGGALHAVGTADAPVVFTALNDQQHGAFDTLNRPAPQKADWGGIGVTAAGGTLDVDNAEVYYGSSPVDAGDAEIYVDGSGNPTVSIQNSTIEAAKDYGINAGTAPATTVIRGDIFNADNYPLLINGGLSFDDSNLFAPKGEVHNTHNAIYVRPNATIAADGARVMWTKRLVPFILQGDETVGANGILTIGPDVILKGRDGASSLTVQDGGSLVVNGQPGHYVLMTAYSDDAQGGDSNGDGKSTSPQRGDWHGIVVKGTSRLYLHRVKLWWAGSSGRPAIHIADNATAVIGRSEVAESGGDGISDTSARPVEITNTTIHDNAGYGLNFSSTPDARAMTTLAAVRAGRNGRGDVGVDDAPASMPSPGAAPTAPAPTPDMTMLTPPAGATPAASATASPATPVLGATPTPVPSATATPTPSDTATLATPTAVAALDTVTPTAAATSNTGTPTAAATSNTGTPAAATTTSITADAALTGVVSDTAALAGGDTATSPAADTLTPAPGATGGAG